MQRKSFIINVTDNIICADSEIPRRIFSFEKHMADSAMTGRGIIEAFGVSSLSILYQLNHKFVMDWKLAFALKSRLIQSSDNALNMT